MRPLSLWLPVLVCAGLRPVAVAAQTPVPCAPVPAGYRVEWTVTPPAASPAASTAPCADVLQRRDRNGTRRLRISEGTTLAVVVDHAPKCARCGGAMGDPFTGLAWRNGSLIVTHEGGSRTLWHEDWTLARRTGRWVLAGWERVVTDRLSGQTWRESVNTLAGRATVRYTPPEGGCAALHDAEPSARCDGSAPTQQACAVPSAVLPASAVLLVEERPWACGVRRP